MQIAKSNPSLLLVIFIVAFIIGFVIISKIIDYFQRKNLKQNETKSNSDTYKENNEYKSKQEQNFEQGKYKDRGENLNPEIKYRAIFGFVGPYSRDEVKKRYRELMAQYHPDKVQHLGKEFQIIAEEKTKIIQEAYEYFKKTYNIKD